MDHEDDFTVTLTWGELGPALLQGVKSAQTAVSQQAVAVLGVLDSLISDSVTAVGGTHSLGDRRKSILPPAYSGWQPLMYYSQQLATSITLIAFLCTLTVFTCITLLYLRYKRTRDQGFLRALPFPLLGKKTETIEKNKDPVKPEPTAADEVKSKQYRSSLTDRDKQSKDLTTKLVTTDPNESGEKPKEKQGDTDKEAKPEKKAAHPDHATICPASEEAPKQVLDRTERTPSLQGSPKAKKHTSKANTEPQRGRIRRGSFIRPSSTDPPDQCGAHPRKSSSVRRSLSRRIEQSLENHKKRMSQKEHNAEASPILVGRSRTDWKSFFDSLNDKHPRTKKKKLKQQKNLAKSSKVSPSPPAKGTAMRKPGSLSPRHPPSLVLRKNEKPSQQPTERPKKTNAPKLNSLYGRGAFNVYSQSKPNSNTNRRVTNRYMEAPHCWFTDRVENRRESMTANFANKPNTGQVRYYANPGAIFSENVASKGRTIYGKPLSTGPWENIGNHNPCFICHPFCVDGPADNDEFFQTKNKERRHESDKTFPKHEPSLQSVTFTSKITSDSRFFDSTRGSNEDVSQEIPEDVNELQEDNPYEYSLKNSSDPRKPTSRNKRRPQKRVCRICNRNIKPRPTVSRGLNEYKHMFAEFMKKAQKYEKDHSLFCDGMHFEINEDDLDSNATTEDTNTESRTTSTNPDTNVKSQNYDMTDTLSTLEEQELEDQRGRQFHSDTRKWIRDGSYCEGPKMSEDMPTVATCENPDDNSSNPLKKPNGNKLNLKWRRYHPHRFAPYNPTGTHVASYKLSSFSSRPEKTIKWTEDIDDFSIDDRGAQNKNNCSPNRKARFFFGAHKDPKRSLFPTCPKHEECHYSQPGYDTRSPEDHSQVNSTQVANGQIEDTCSTTITENKADATHTDNQSTCGKTHKVRGGTSHLFHDLQRRSKFDNRTNTALRKQNSNDGKLLHNATRNVHKADDLKAAITYLYETDSWQPKSMAQFKPNPSQFASDEMKNPTNEVNDDLRPPMKYTRGKRILSKTKTASIGHDPQPLRHRHVPHTWNEQCAMTSQPRTASVSPDASVQFPLAPQPNTTPTQQGQSSPPKERIFGQSYGRNLSPPRQRRGGQVPPKSLSVSPLKVHQGVHDTNTFSNHSVPKAMTSLPTTPKRPKSPITQQIHSSTSSPSGEKREGSQVPCDSHNEPSACDTNISVAVQTSPGPRLSCRKSYRFRQRKSYSIMPRLQRERSIMQRAAKSCYRHLKYQRRLSKEFINAQQEVDQSMIQSYSKAPSTGLSSHGLTQNHASQTPPDNYWLSDFQKSAITETPVNIRHMSVNPSQNIMSTSRCEADAPGGNERVRGPIDDSFQINPVEEVHFSHSETEVGDRAVESAENHGTSILSLPSFKNNEEVCGELAITEQDYNSPDRSHFVTSADRSDSSYDPSRMSGRNFVPRPMWQNLNIDELNRRVERALKLREQMQRSKTSKDNTGISQGDKRVDVTTGHVDNAHYTVIERNTSHERSDQYTSIMQQLSSEPLNATVVPSGNIGNNGHTENNQRNPEFTETIETSMRHHCNVDHTVGTAVSDDSKEVCVTHQDRSSSHKVMESSEVHENIHWSNAPQSDNTSGQNGASKRAAGRHHKNSPPTKISKVENVSDGGPVQCRLVGDVVQSLPQVPLSSFVEWFIETSDPNSFLLTDHSSSSSDKRDDTGNNVKSIPGLRKEKARHFEFQNQHQGKSNVALSTTLPESQTSHVGKTHLKPKTKDTGVLSHQIYVGPNDRHCSLERDEALQSSLKRHKLGTIRDRIKKSGLLETRQRPKPSLKSSPWSAVTPSSLSRPSLLPFQTENQKTDSQTNSGTYFGEAIATKVYPPQIHSTETTNACVTGSSQSTGSSGHQLRSGANVIRSSPIFPNRSENCKSNFTPKDDLNRESTVPVVKTFSEPKAASLISEDHKSNPDTLNGLSKANIRHILMKLRNNDNSNVVASQRKKMRITLRRSSGITGIMAKFQQHQ